MGRPKGSKSAPDMRGIRQGANGRYYWDVVRVLPDGSRFRKASDHANSNDAITARAAALADYEAIKAGAQQLANDGYTVETWCLHCLDNVMPTQASRRGKPYSPKTIDEYRTIVKLHIAPKIGSVRLAKLNVDHVDTLIAGIDSEALRVNVHKTLSRMCELAEDKSKRPRNSNPCRAVRIGRTKVRRTDATTVIKTKVKTGRKVEWEETPVPAGLIIDKIRVLSFDEEAALITYTRNHPEYSDYVTLLLLGLRLGLRIGEALGLDWSAVDFERNIVRIDQQAARVKGQGILASDPKSGAGFREIPMPRSLADHLRGVKLLSSSPHVVHNKAGKRRDDKRAAERIRDLMVGAGINDKVDGRRFLPRPTFHDLRRTCLTRLATGRVAPSVVVTPVPPTVLIRISGHEDVNTLLSYYVTADDSMVADAMALMP